MSQNHWACQWLSWNLNPGSLPPDPTTLSTIQIFSLSYDMKPTCPHYDLDAGVLGNELTTSLLHTALNWGLHLLCLRNTAILYSLWLPIYISVVLPLPILFYSANYCILWPGWFSFSLTQIASLLGGNHISIHTVHSRVSASQISPCPLVTQGAWWNANSDLVGLGRAWDPTFLTGSLVRMIPLVHRSQPEWQCSRAYNAHC